MFIGIIIWRADRVQLAKLVTDPTAWFVFGAAFFGTASLPLDDDVFPDFYKLPRSEAAQAVFLPLLPIAAFGFLIVTNSITRGTFRSALGISHLSYPFS